MNDERVFFSGKVLSIEEIEKGKGGGHSMFPSFLIFRIYVK